MNRRDFLASSLAGLSLQSMRARTLPAGPQLELRQEQARDGRPRFEVAFLNRTTSPLVLDTGVVVGDGRTYAGRVQFSLKDAHGRVRLLVKRDPQYVAGWMAPYIVEVPANGAFRISSIDLIDYWSHEPGISILHLPAGRYALTADFEGRDPNKDFVSAGQPYFRRWPKTFWTGNLKSNTIEFAFRSPV
jgi:hypothetical protein